MIRRFLLPTLAIAMLGGCVTSGYQYRGGYGDYYYGQPQVEYREYGAPYGNVGYGYPGGWMGSFGYGYGGYGWPYGNYYGGYYDPYHHHGSPRRPPVVVPPRPGDDDGGVPPPSRHEDPGQSPPWRDLVRLRRPGVTAPMQPQRPSVGPPSSRGPQPWAGERPPRAPADRQQQSSREPERDIRRIQEP